MLEWWNLVFILPFLLAVVYYLVLATGTVAIDDDHDYDHEGIEHASGSEHTTSSYLHVLGLLGIGRAPLSIVLTTLCLVWGFVGYASNQLLDDLLPPSVFPWVSLAVAAVAAALLTRAFARLVARLVPRTQSYGVSRHELRGRAAQVRFEITETFGSATVVDQQRFPHEVDCRVRPGEPPIPVGASVYLVEYDPERNLFFVMSEQKLEDLIAAR
jgi:hypothetical protein